MKEITTHHDGHGLNESIAVLAVDEIGPGGAHHRYEFINEVTGGGSNSQREERTGAIQFQKGPRNEPGSTPGVTSEAIISMLIDHLQEFQEGPFPTDEGRDAIKYLAQAQGALRTRADNRAQRGVLGRNLA